MVGDLFLRVGGRELGLSHGERDVSARDPRVYSVGTFAGGAAAPAFFGALIATKKPSAILLGYAVAAAAMLGAAAIQLRYGVEAAGKSLEEIAPPLASTT